MRTLKGLLVNGMHTPFPSKEKNMWKTILLAFVGILICCLQALPQSNASSGEIKGTTTDASGGVVPGATVTVTNTNTGFSRTAITDERGEYRILLLPPGAYEVRVELSGFAAQVRNAQVIVGQTLAIDFRLQVGTSAQTVTVSGEPPVIETERATQSNTIEENYIRNLPIDRRDYLSFTLLAPGVVDSNALADNTDFRVTQSPQSGLSFYGSNGRGNSVTVDGAEANDAGGGVRSTLSQEAVQEFQINRSNYAAEFGGASGGVINIVSKSGSNDFHGRALWFLAPRQAGCGGSLCHRAGRNHAAAHQAAFPTAAVRRDPGLPHPEGSNFFLWRFRGTQSQRIIGRAGSDRPVDLSAHDGSNRDSRRPGFQYQHGSDCVPAGGSRRAAMLPPAACATVLRGALTSKQSTVDLFRGQQRRFPFHHKLEGLLGPNRP